MNWFLCDHQGHRVASSVALGAQVASMEESALPHANRKLRDRALSEDKCPKSGFIIAACDVCSENEGS